LNAYTAQEHGVLKTLFERQSAMLKGRVCDESTAGMKQLSMRADQILNFEALSEARVAQTGWRVVAVPSLVPDELFFEHLANRRFPAGQFIRHAHQLDYLQEPDVFHDVFGHVPMLMNPQVADFIQAYGEGGLRAQSLRVLEKLARLYWYTIEFGLVQQADGLRIYGAWIASSFSESLFSLESPSPNRVGFDTLRVMKMPHRIDDFQDTCFVLPHLNELFKLAGQDFFTPVRRASWFTRHTLGASHCQRLCYFEGADGSSSRFKIIINRLNAKTFL
jgi:phenylalanine-4-hydroxylase